ncbi:hypothetical protein C2S52_015069 [Perilla frutescens var. hirtella]|nr:hypothetical protein C2S52_015069 [Perilla frutescens var. hirtella]
MVACIAAVAAGGGGNQQPSGEIVKFCGATGFKETCMKSVAKANSTKPKDLIKAAFDSTVAEIQIAIKNTTTYKKAAADKWIRGALDVCECVLDRSIDDIRKSFDNINSFEVGKVDHALDDVKIWLSSAITNKETCLDAFAKTKGKTGTQVKEMLKSTGELMHNALAMVIEFQKLFKSINIGAIVDHFKQRQLLGDGSDTDVAAADFSTIHSRKLLDTPPLALSLPPNVTVAQDGSGKFKSIQEAVNTAPLGSEVPFVIFVKAGVYKEYVMIPKKAKNVVLIGEGPFKTRISGDKSFTSGVPTFHSATLKVEGENFSAKDIGIENTAGAGGHQAVAVRASGDLGLFYNVHMDGYQDTLYAHTNRQFFRECSISGTIDFIFGNSIAIFQKCTMVVRKPDPNQACMVTAQGRIEKNLTGVTVLQGCTITAEKALLDTQPPVKAYLGRPWKELSRTIVMQSTIEGFIAPEGWSPWMGDFALATLYYVEYNNTGPGASYAGRVKWGGMHNFTDIEEARSFTAKPQFKWDDWVTKTGVPYAEGFM